jgi:hypothetical protein
MPSSLLFPLLGLGAIGALVLASSGDSTPTTGKRTPAAGPPGGGGAQQKKNVAVAVTDCYAGLPPAIAATAKGFDIGTAASMRMAAANLDLVAQNPATLPQVKAAAVSASKCLRSKADGMGTGVDTKTDGWPTGTGGLPTALPTGLPTTLPTGVPSGTPTQLECAAMIKQFRSIPGYEGYFGKTLDSGSADELNALATQLETFASNPIGPGDPTWKLFFAKTAICLRTMAKNKGGGGDGGDVEVVKGCIKGSDGEDLPDSGWTALAAAKPEFMTTATTAAASGDTKTIRDLANQLRENCQGTAAGELELAANGIETGKTPGMVGLGIPIPKWPT